MPSKTKFRHLPLVSFNEKKNDALRNTGLSLVRVDVLSLGFIDTGGLWIAFRGSMNLEGKNCIFISMELVSFVMLCILLYVFKIF